MCFRRCPECGAWLDPCEICDCEYEESREPEE